MTYVTDASRYKRYQINDAPKFARPMQVGVASVVAARQKLIVLGLAAAIREEAAMNSSVKKRSIVIGGHKTSISLEDNFWISLRQIACERATTPSELIRMLDVERDGGNLSSAIRVFVLDHYRNYVARNPHATANPSCMNLATIPERAEGPAIPAAAS